MGVVIAVQAYRWFRVNLIGRDTHIGTTAFEHRADALYAFSRMVARAREVAAAKGCLASVVIIEAKLGSVNTVPGQVSLDVRGPEDNLVVEVETELKGFDAIAAEGAGIVKPCRVEWFLDFDSPAVKFYEDYIDCATVCARCWPYI